MEVLVETPSNAVPDAPVKRKPPSGAAKRKARAENVRFELEQAESEYNFVSALALHREGCESTPVEAAARVALQRFKVEAVRSSDSSSAARCAGGARAEKIDARAMAVGLAAAVAASACGSSPEEAASIAAGRCASSGRIRDLSSVFVAPDGTFLRDASSIQTVLNCVAPWTRDHEMHCDKCGSRGAETLQCCVCPRTMHLACFSNPAHASTFRRYGILWSCRWCSEFVARTMTNLTSSS